MCVGETTTYQYLLEFGNYDFNLLNKHVAYQIWHPKTIGGWISFPPKVDFQDFSSCV